MSKRFQHAISFLCAFSAVATAFWPSAALGVASQAVSSGKSASRKDSGIVALTRVVGEVSGRIVTSRETQIADAIAQTLEGRKPSQLHVLTTTESDFPAAVGRALNDWAVYLEAKSFSSKPPLRVEVEKQLRSVDDLFGRRADWQKLEVSDSELQQMIERKLVADEFTRLKSEASQAPITESDAQAYFKKNRLKFGNLPFEDFRDNIKAFLAKQQVERRIKEWFDVLGQKYRVRNYVAG